MNATQLQVLQYVVKHPHKETTEIVDGMNLSEDDVINALAILKLWQYVKASIDAQTVWSATDYGKANCGLRLRPALIPSPDQELENLLKGR